MSNDFNSGNSPPSILFEFVVCPSDPEEGEHGQGEAGCPLVAPEDAPDHREGEGGITRQRGDALTSPDVINIRQSRRKICVSLSNVNNMGGTQARKGRINLVFKHLQGRSWHDLLILFPP